LSSDSGLDNFFFLFIIKMNDIILEIIEKENKRRMQWRKHNRKYYEKNREERLRKMRENYYANLEKRRAYQRDYARRHQQAKMINVVG